VQVTERTRGGYETQDARFGTVYRWCPRPSREERSLPRLAAERGERPAQGKPWRERVEYAEIDVRGAGP
jgi:hypothetical protein